MQVLSVLWGNSKLKEASILSSNLVLLWVLQLQELQYDSRILLLVEEYSLIQTIQIMRYFSGKLLQGHSGKPLLVQQQV
jgi:hypothetical protein